MIKLMLLITPRFDNNLNDNRWHTMKLQEHNYS